MLRLAFMCLAVMPLLSSGTDVPHGRACEYEGKWYDNGEEWLQDDNECIPPCHCTEGVVDCQYKAIDHTLACPPPPCVDPVPDPQPCVPHCMKCPNGVNCDAMGTIIHGTDQKLWFDPGTWCECDGISPVAICIAHK